MKKKKFTQIFAIVCAATLAAGCGSSQSTGSVADTESKAKTELAEKSTEIKETELPSEAPTESVEAPSTETEELFSTETEVVAETENTEETEEPTLTPEQIADLATNLPSADTYDYVALGNSVTTNVTDDLWHGSWGMAATSQSNDYVHIVGTWVGGQVSQPVNVQALTIEEWEKAPDRNYFYTDAAKPHAAAEALNNANASDADNSSSNDADTTDTNSNSSESSAAGTNSSSTETGTTGSGNTAAKSSTTGTSTSASDSTTSAADTTADENTSEEASTKPQTPMITKTEISQMTMMEQIDTYVNENTDLITIQSGENITDNKGDLVGDYSKLIGYIKEKAPNARIYMLSEMLWPSGDIEAAKQAVCGQYGLAWADMSEYLSGYDTLYKSSLGVTYIGDDGNTYAIDNEVVAAHPSDAGMANIAQQVINVLTVGGLK